MTALVAGAIGSYGVLVRNRDDATPVAERPPQPGYYLKDAVITYMLPSGAPRVRFVAELMEQNPADDSITAHGVKMDYLAIPGRPWTMTAREALAPPDLDRVQFRGSVEVRGEQAQRVAVIRTESLVVDTMTNVATTRDPVEIDFAGQRLRATGLRADLSSERLQLESAIHGNFRRP